MTLKDGRAERLRALPATLVAGLGLLLVGVMLVVTHGKSGSQIFKGSDLIEGPVFAPTAIKDPTGVGDAYRSGLLTGIAQGWPLKLAGEVGALCATRLGVRFGPWIGVRVHRPILSQPKAQGKPQVWVKSGSGRCASARRR